MSVNNEKKKSLCQMTDAEIDECFQLSVQQAIEAAKEKGLPYCGFDMEKKQSYIQYPDGRREYADE